MGPHVARRHRDQSPRKYHDRVAARYDATYDNDAYWSFYRELTWRHLKRFLPTDLSARVLDVGAGTGLWGLRLAKSGFRVMLTDISPKMLDQARRKAEEQGLESRCEFAEADITDLAGLPDGAFALVIAQGDPLSFSPSAPKAAASLRRVTAPGGAVVASVDALYGALPAFLEAGESARLPEFLRTGRSEWLAHDPGERFPVTHFTPDGLRRLFERAGFEVARLIGKTVLPVRRFREALEDPSTFDLLLGVEESLHAEEALLGCASHLEIAARVPKT